MNELDASPAEETDLLIKYLGAESSKYAISIKTANAHEPSYARDEIWIRLEEMYGRPELVEVSIKKKLNSFTKISKDYKRLYDLLDILCEIQYLKANPVYTMMFSYFDSSSGVNPIVSKLPYNLQDKWTNRASQYKHNHQVMFPPFSFFVNFVREISRTKNDPAFQYKCEQKPEISKPFKVFARKTEEVQSLPKEKETNTDQNAVTIKRCPIHNAQHSLLQCRTFLQKTLEEKKRFVREKNICFKCLDSVKHYARDFRVAVKCSICGKGHVAALHGGETQNKQDVTAKCTTLCGDTLNGRSCSKTVLVDIYPKGQFEKAVRAYVIIDDQSNCSLGTGELFDKLSIYGQTTPYTLSSCNDRATKFGRRTNDICIKSIDGSTEIDVPRVIECDDIPNELSEIPTPDVARAYSHLNHIADTIPNLQGDCKVQLLIGRDVPEAHHVMDQAIGSRGTPFAQKLALGWVIVGEVCSGRVHTNEDVSVYKTYIMPDGRGTHIKPCQFNLNIKENQDPDFQSLDDTLFVRTVDDDTTGLSAEDKQFVKLMDSKMERDQNGFWTAPLPFKDDRPELPNNRAQAWRRVQILDNSLKNNSVKRQHFVTFMGKVIDSGAAEVAPCAIQQECWYLPLFGVYNPKKPGQIRGVFDSSAVYQNISLNSVLMSGPDMINSLLGILLRFRRDEVAVSADVEQMFYRFRVTHEHRDFLRFLWYRDNDPDKELIEYRMCVHVFGNCASPSVATYGLRKAVQTAEKDIQNLVNKDFYVDDCLTSKPTVDQAIITVKRTQTALRDGGNIRLHKIASNNVAVMHAFPQEDLGGDLKSLDLSVDPLPAQRSLGLAWDLKKDAFIFNIEMENKPFTRRGVLSMVNSIYDPLGFIAPITISGKILLREATPSGVDWDAPLPPNHEMRWLEWKQSLQNTETIAIPRAYTTISFSTAKKSSVNIFSDASEVAIAAVSYLKVIDQVGESSSGFLLGKAKLAPTQGHSIPRLELCGAVLATELAVIISKQLDIPIASMTFFTDNKVVLGYICNETRRFYTYVSNRVERILNVSTPEQWQYVSTTRNPADCATRCRPVCLDVSDSMWIKGPPLLKDQELQIEDNIEESKNYDLINPENDSEIRPEVLTRKTVNVESSITSKFEKFSTWQSLVRAFALLKRSCKDHKKVAKPDVVTSHIEAENFIVRIVQESSYEEEIQLLLSKRAVPASSSLSTLSPFLDEKSVLRVGGRLTKADVPSISKQPIIIPKKSHIALLLVRHFHEKVQHQGRLLTESTLRNNGFWIIGAKRLISSTIHKCVICKRQRGKFQSQYMSDLPEDRVTPSAPFTVIGVDTFGPWHIVARKTRGGFAESKRWGMLFTCLSTRAVHIEVIEELSSSAFINAFRRFVAIRGPVKEVRSDRGTNFIGALDDLKAEGICVEDGPVKKYLHDSKITWKFNPPHSSHMGGVWERIIGLTRRILDSMLLKTHAQKLTHYILCTFMCEVCAIINSRPIASISTDPDDPEMMTPGMLLTQKKEPLEGLDSTLSMRDIYKAQWKYVQVMANTFWKQWRNGYLQTLQTRRKWPSVLENLKTGDVVLVKDVEEHRNHWPLGIVVRVFQSGSDSNIRSVEVRIVKDKKCVNYVRPITELVLLVD
ncbi:uncharacterized protein LOC128244575 [Mya arenaria]|uniref:uncharacterized protein LOC128244575 n=1 Tax=Mya arenaria TaxID=6604 RepID=UPI0022E010B0|nr:uncharacterized protein LOC128244575 [Mya arenaria]